MTGILGLAGRGLHGLFQCDSGPQSGQRTGHTSLDQVLLLVEVDVELVEAGDLAAFGGADGVVAQVDEDTQQVMLLAGLVGAGQTLELLSGVQLVDVQRGSQISLGVVDAAAVGVAGQQHHIHQMRRAEEVGSAGTLELLAGVERGRDDRLGVDVVLAETGAVPVP